MTFGAKFVLAIISIALAAILISMLLPVFAIIGALTVCWLIFKLIDQDTETDELDEKRPPNYGGLVQKCCTHLTYS